MPGRRSGGASSGGTGLVGAPVVARADTQTATGLSNGTNTGANYRRSHKSSEALSTFRVELANWGHFSTTPANDIVIRTAIEYPAGTFSPVFFQGKRDVTINAFGTAESDPLTVNIPANTQFWTRTFVTVTSGGKWVTGDFISSALGEACSQSTTEVDLTTSGTISGFGFGVYPVAIRSLYHSSSVAALLLMGDSIPGGVGDWTVNSPNGGWAQRALMGNIAYQRFAGSGERANWLATDSLGGRRWAAAIGFNRMLCTLGINDIIASRTFAQVQADLQTIWAAAVARGVTKIWQATLLPQTTSTDLWSTTANQTVKAQEAVRTQINDWIRTVPAPLTGILELADVVETSRNSGIWKMNGHTGTGTTTSGSPNITAATGNTFANGDIVVGAGIPSGAYVVSGGGTATLVLSANATASASGVSLLSAPTGDGAHPAPIIHAALAAAVTPSTFA